MRRLLLLLLLALVLAQIGPAPALARDGVQPILRMELEKALAVPGQPIILRITVLSPTWFLKPPVFPSFEVPNVIVRLPEGGSNPTMQVVDGERWSGVTRGYRVYPMIPGRFRIPSLPVSVTFADPETRKPVGATLRTNEVEFDGVAPPGGETLDPFIAAEALSLEQTIEGEPGTLEPGGAITRTVTATVAGTSPIFLPPLIPALSAKGLSEYPKEPVVNETEERGFLSGDRVESVTYVPEAGGRHPAPPIKVSWYNLRQQRIETAEVAGFEIVSSGPPLVEPSRKFDWRGAGPWIILAALLVALVGGAALRLWPRLDAWRLRRRKSFLASETFAFHQARAALRTRDFHTLVPALELWSSRLPPTAGGADAGLSDALARLGAAHYGCDRSPPSEGDWSAAGEALRTARRARLVASAADRADSALPPLNPRRDPREVAHTTANVSLLGRG